MTKQEFVITSLTALSEMFDKKLSDSLMKMYWEALKDFEYDDLQKGFSRAIKECRFFPKPVELSDLMGCSAADKALIAFGKLCDAIEDHGRTRSVAFDDPVIHSVVRELGGWEKCCLWERDELPFRQKDFERWYGVYKNSERPHPAYIAGTNETQNAGYLEHPLHSEVVKKGMKIEFIGDLSKDQTFLMESRTKLLTKEPNLLIKDLVDKLTLPGGDDATI